MILLVLRSPNNCAIVTQTQNRTVRSGTQYPFPVVFIARGIAGRELDGIEQRGEGEIDSEIAASPQADTLLPLAQKGGSRNADTVNTRQ